MAKFNPTQSLKYKAFSKRYNVTDLGNGLSRIEFKGNDSFASTVYIDLAIEKIRRYNLYENDEKFMRNMYWATPEGFNRKTAILKDNLINAVEQMNGADERVIEDILDKLLKIDAWSLDKMVKENPNVIKFSFEYGNIGKINPRDYGITGLSKKKLDAEELSAELHQEMALRLNGLLSLYM